MIVSSGRYTYDHKALLDYNCIVNSNYNLKDSDGNYITDSSGWYIRGNGNLNETIQYLSDSKRKAYRIAVGKERNNLYKSLDYDTNYGYEIDTSGSSSISFNSRSKQEVFRIEVVIENTSSTTTNLYTDNITLKCGSYEYSVVIPTTSTATRTVTFEVTDVLEDGNSIEISFGDTGTTTELKSVKIYYK